MTWSLTVLRSDSEYMLLTYDSRWPCGVGQPPNMTEHKSVCFSLPFIGQRGTWRTSPAVEICCSSRELGSIHHSVTALTQNHLRLPVQTMNTPRNIHVHKYVCWEGRYMHEKWNKYAGKISAQGSCSPNVHKLATKTNQTFTRYRTVQHLTSPYPKCLGQRLRF